VVPGEPRRHRVARPARCGNARGRARSGPRHGRGRGAILRRRLGRRRLHALRRAGGAPAPLRRARHRRRAPDPARAPDRGQLPRLPPLQISRRAPGAAVHRESESPGRQPRGARRAGRGPRSLPRANRRRRRAHLHPGRRRAPGPRVRASPGRESGFHRPGGACPGPRADRSGRARPDPGLPRAPALKRHPARGVARSVRVPGPGARARARPGAGQLRSTPSCPMASSSRRVVRAGSDVSARPFGDNGDPHAHPLRGRRQRRAKQSPGSGTGRFSHRPHRPVATPPQFGAKLSLRRMSFLAAGLAVAPGKRSSPALVAARLR
jgi:hypothetical protein